MALLNMSRMTEDSISVFDGTPVYFPKTDTIKPINVSETLMKFSGRRVYSVKNGVIAFLFEGCCMVTPSTEQKIKLLKENGFEEEEFFVPFSDGGVPELRKKFWEELLEDASYHN